MTQDALNDLHQDDQDDEIETTAEERRPLAIEPHLGDEPDDNDEHADDSEEDAAMASAFDAERGKTPSRVAPSTSQETGSTEAADTDTSNTEQQTAQTTTTQSAASAAAPAAAGATPDVKDIVNAAVRDAEQRIKSQLGREISALKKAAGQAATDTRADGGNAPTQQEIDAAAKAGGEKWKKLQDDFPEWADAMEERFGANPGAQVDAKALADQVIAHVDERLQAEAAARAKRTVERKHQGYVETINTPEFKAWHDAQPAEVKALAESDEPEDAIDLLDRYKAHVETPRQTPRQPQTPTRLRTAVTPAGRGSGGMPAVQNEDDAMEAGFASVRGSQAR